MAIEVKINNVSIQYPQIGDTEWGNNATNFAIQTATAFNAIGLSDGTTVDLPGILDVTGNTTLDANLSVGGTTSLTGNVTLTNNLTVNGDVAINTDKFNVTASTGNTTIAGTLGVTSDITTSGILTASNSTNVTTAPPITFTGDTNTGIGHSAADTLDLVTGGVPRSRLNSTGQQSSVVPDLSGSNTNLYNEYKCRAWINFNGTTASPSTIRASGNVSSVTKTSTGDYTVNFLNNMPDVNYAVSITGNNNTVGNIAIGSVHGGTYTASAIRIFFFNSGFASVDPLQCFLQVFR